MKKERKDLPLSRLQPNTGQADWLPSNPREWTAQDVTRTARSIKEDPDFLEDRPLLVFPHGEDFIVFAGNLRREGCIKEKMKSAPCVIYYPDNDADYNTIKRRAMKDNGSFGKFDYDALANEWDELPLADYGIEVWEMEEKSEEEKSEEEMDKDEIARKEQEFKDRMAAGEISEEDEEYQAFLEKFKLKKTTDDCYTPVEVYEAVANWVAKEYNLQRKDFVRPFYPGGDYQNEDYPDGCVVVDNPPFSILSEILKFYNANKIRFFLFAPHLTLFSSSSQFCCALPSGVAVTYENGASVNTSFLTNLEDKALRLRSVPTLYKAVKEANDANLRNLHKELPKYSYDHHVITTTFIGQLSRLGIDFRVPVLESEPIAQLESQKESGKAIYGKGYIVSEQVFVEREKAEREKAEREKAEREKAERWELSPKEQAIVEKLTERAKRPIPAE